MKFVYSQFNDITTHILAVLWGKEQGSRLILMAPQLGFPETRGKHEVEKFLLRLNVCMSRFADHKYELNFRHLNPI